MKKRILSFILLFLMTGALMLTLTGCGIGRRLAIGQGSATQEQVTVTLKRARAVRMRLPDRYEYSFSGTIENNSDESVMKVIYTFTLYDKNGEEFRSFADVYDGVDRGIPPHGKIDFSLDGVKWGAQSVPGSVSIGISSVQTETELPPARLPQPGEYLYQALGNEKLAAIREHPPASISLHVDQGGYGRTATFGEGELLDEALELFCAIKIGEETDSWVTDNYNWIRLTWEDGTETYISLNLYSLEYFAHSSPHMYTLEGLDAFWSFAAEYLADD